MHWISCGKLEKKYIINIDQTLFSSLLTPNKLCRWEVLKQSPPLFLHRTQEELFLHWQCVQVKQNFHQCWLSKVSRIIGLLKKSFQFFQLAMGTFVRRCLNLSRLKNSQTINWNNIREYYPTACVQFLLMQHDVIGFWLNPTAQHGSWAYPWLIYLTLSACWCWN